MRRPCNVCGRMKTPTEYIRIIKRRDYAVGCDEDGVGNHDDHGGGNGDDGYDDDNANDDGASVLVVSQICVFWK